MSDTTTERKSAWKCFAPWIILFLIVAVLESVYYFRDKPNDADRTNFLRFTFADPDNLQRLQTFEKLHDLVDTGPEVIQVGDSSGLHAIQPYIVMQYLPGYKFVNYNVATTLGYRGYLGVARYALRKNPRAKYLILYAQLFGGNPREILWDDPKLIGWDVQHQFDDPFYRAFQVPTLALREKVTDELYYLHHKFKAADAPRLSNDGYRMFHEIFQSSLGWCRETDVPGDARRDIWANLISVMQGDLSVLNDPEIARIAKALNKIPSVKVESFYDWTSLRRKTYISEIYEEFYELAKQHNVKLIILFNPMPESARRKLFESFFFIGEIEQELDRFRAKHPDVYVQKDLQYWPDRMFSVFSHIATPYAEESSHWYGRRLAEIIGGTPKPVDPARLPKNPDKLVLDFKDAISAYGWLDPEPSPDGRTMRYIGPRAIAMVFALGPDKESTICLELGKFTPEALKLLRAKVNGQYLAPGEVGTGANGVATVTWRLPAELAKRYTGWLNMTFSVQPGTHAPGTDEWNLPTEGNRPKQLAAERLTITAREQVIGHNHDFGPLQLLCGQPRTIKKP